MVVLDAEGKRQSDIRIPDRMMHWIVDADLRGEGELSWCGLCSPKIGESLAVGWSLDGKELWSYALPPGILPQPIEPIIPGRLTRKGSGHWILPGPDGSIHILSADGHLFDKFNTGTTLQGLATAKIDDEPVLIVASSNGLEAWKVKVAKVY